MADRALRIELFAISYVPLYAILALRTMPSWHDIWCVIRARDLSEFATPLVFTAATAFGLALAVVLVRHARRLSGTTIRVKAASDRGREAAAYLSSYILPFVMFDEDSWRIWAAFGVYLIVLAIITVNSDLVLTNPTLYLLRRNIAEVETTRSRGPGDEFTSKRILICKAVPDSGDEVDVIEFAGGYLEKSR